MAIWRLHRLQDHIKIKAAAPKSDLTAWETLLGELIPGLIETLREGIRQAMTGDLGFNTALEMAGIILTSENRVDSVAALVEESTPEGEDA